MSPESTQGTKSSALYLDLNMTKSTISSLHMAPLQAHPFFN